MGFPFRILSEQYIIACSCTGDCTNCVPVNHSSNRIRTVLLSTFLTLFAVSLLCVSCYAFYVKFCLTSSRRRRVALEEARNPAREEFIDEVHGPVLDHPIWYIHTVGLQQAVINSIPLCKYKKGEGLIEGTECSVCLSEFEEDENLRLLPKCSHAFHISCIDTWLRSHTNCPMCRAPIVASNPAGGTSSSGAIAPVEETLAPLSETEEQVNMETILVEDERETGDIGKINVVLDVGEEERQRIRRTLSLDSLSSLDSSKDSKNDSVIQFREDEEDMIRNRPRTDTRRSGCSSSNSGRNSVHIMRSCSLGSVSFSSRYSRSRTLILPL